MLQIETCLRVCLNLKPTTTEVAFTPEGEDGRGVIFADLLLLSVVSDAHADVSVACATVREAVKEVWLREYKGATYHQILKGSSKRVMRIPWSILRARSPKACLPVDVRMTV